MSKKVVHFLLDARDLLRDIDDLVVWRIARSQAGGSRNRRNSDHARTGDKGPHESLFHRRTPCPQFSPVSSSELRSKEAAETTPAHPLSGGDAAVPSVEASVTE
jgi:hypothetical protein